MCARLICTAHRGAGGYWDGGMDTDIDAEGRMGSRVRMAIATTAVGRPHHLDVNNADADDSHSDSDVACISTPTPTRLSIHTDVTFSLRTGDAAVDALRWRWRRKMSWIVV